MKIHKREENLVTLYGSGIRNPENMPIEQISLKSFVIDVKYGRWMGEVDAYRSEKDEVTKTRKKTQLPYTTISANFRGRRKKGMEDYMTKYVTLDIDTKDTKIPYIVDPHIKAQFHSVGGHGLCIVVEVDQVDHFKHSFNYVKDYFESNHDVVVDLACKDHTRARFVSYDEYAEYTESSTVMHIPDYSSDNSAVKQPTITDQWSYEVTRNFVSGLLHQGMGQQSAMKMMLSLSSDRWSESTTFGNDETREDKLRVLVDSIYGLYGDQMGQSVQKQKKIRIASTLSDLENDTGIYKEVRALLPKILQDICDSFTRKGDQDAALLSALSLFSQMFINCYFEMGTVGIQTGQLFSWLVGEAGSGKSVMSQVKKMFDKVELDFHSERADRLELFNMYNSASPKEQKEWQEEGRDVPTNPYTGFFTPSDVTAASLIKALDDTSGLGVLYATEADTLSKFSGGENSISTLLRNAYEGEQLFMARAGHQAPVNIERLTMSMLISSTPAQVKTLVANIEDGLFSRFMFDVLPTTEKIISLFKTKKIDHSSLQHKVYDVYTKSGYTQVAKGNNSLKPTRFLKHEFSEPKDEDYMHFIHDMDSILQDMIGNVSGSLASSVTRATTRMFRIAMTLSALKILESRALSGNEEFDSASIKAGFQISRHYLMKNLSVMRVFGSDIAESKNEIESKKEASMKRRVEVCERVAKDDSITDKNVEAVKLLCDEGDRITVSAFRVWKSRHQKKTKVFYW